MDTVNPVIQLRKLFKLLLVLPLACFCAQPVFSQGQARNALAQYQQYQLGAGDLIAISVYGETDLSFEVKIGDSGRITYPFLGEIQVTGNTTQELEGLITHGLIDGEFLIRPEVTVNIVEYRPFYVNGEVQDPGSYPFEPGLTLRKAITIAGGFTERASRSRISIISGSSDSGESVIAESLDIFVKPDDIISVSQRLF